MMNSWTGSLTASRMTTSSHVSASVMRLHGARILSFILPRHLHQNGKTQGTFRHVALGGNCFSKRSCGVMEGETMKLVRRLLAMHRHLGHERGKMTVLYGENTLMETSLLLAEAAREIQRLKRHQADKLSPPRRAILSR